MEILRQIENVVLNKGNGASEGLFNLFNTETKEVSFWFDEDEANTLLEMGEEEFLAEARVKFEYADMA
jgi:hypothetical protein